MTRPDGLDADVRGAAFRLLLARGKPVGKAELGREIGASPGDVVLAINRLQSAGRIRIDEAGDVIGSAGLNVVPDRHRIQFDSRTFWTWCAYDILGIMGALRATGTALSTSPSSGQELRLEFTRGLPDESSAVLFRPDDNFAAGCTNTYADWCPNSNFFESAEEAREWSTRHGVSGHILGIDEASTLATVEWARLLEAQAS